MINYYYEIKDNVTVFGYKCKYLALYDIKPQNMMWNLHDTALKHSNRAWLENANGVTMVKALPRDHSWGNIDEKEFLWIKLQCRDIEML